MKKSGRYNERTYRGLLNLITRNRTVSSYALTDKKFLENAAKCQVFKWRTQNKKKINESRDLLVAPNLLVSLAM